MKVIFGQQVKPQIKTDSFIPPPRVVESWKSKHCGPFFMEHSIFDVLIILNFEKHEKLKYRNFVIRKSFSWICESHFWPKSQAKNTNRFFYPSAKGRRELTIKASGVIFYGEFDFSCFDSFKFRKTWKVEIVFFCQNWGSLGVFGRQPKPKATNLKPQQAPAHTAYLTSSPTPPPR